MKKGDQFSIASINAVNPSNDDYLWDKLKVGDIFTFDVLSTRYKVVSVNPITIEPLDKMRMPQRYVVTSDAEIKADLA